MVAPAAYADHLPAGVNVDPHPALGVPDPLGVPGASLGSLNLSTPGVLPDLPDIVPIMPTVSAISPAGSFPAIFIDTYVVPGSVLYRFDAVLGNIGGALDLYCASCNLPSQVLWQVVWEGGHPSSAQLPDTPPTPPGPGVSEWRDLTTRGAFESFSSAFDHDHWHYDLAGLYEILVPGGASRRDSKIGFCMYDTYDAASSTSYYPPGARGWCKGSQPDAGLVRMGISPGIGDYYSAQLTDQWIDVTGLEPGAYTLRAEVNPQRFIDESDTTNNVEEYDRVIPGATAANGTHALTAGAEATLTFSGSVVAPEIPARRAASCTVWDTGCYVDGTGKTLGNPGDGKASLTFTIIQGPQHGTLSGPPTTSGETVATAIYTAAPDYVGPDTITYTTTDERGLTSTPATIAIAVGAAPAIAVAVTRSRVNVELKAKKRKGARVILKLAVLNRRDLAGKAKVAIEWRKGRRWRPAKTRWARFGYTMTIVFRAKKPGAYRFRARLIAGPWWRSRTSSVAKMRLPARAFRGVPRPRG